MTTSVFGLAVALSACAEEPVTVRVLPQPLATNREPFRIGLQMGFPDEGDGPLKAERLAGRPIRVETNVTVETFRDVNTGKPVYRVENASAQAGGVVLESGALRKNTGYTVRLRCRLVKGLPALRFRFLLASGEAGEATEKVSPIKGEESLEKAFAVRPYKDGACRCGFQVEPGGVLELSGFSMMPDDAVDGWSGQALEALRSLGPAAVRWPVARGLTQYNWYQGVGPVELRQPPSSGPDGAAAFGTAEFAGFCRLIGAEPVLRVTVPAFGKAGVDAEKTREDVQRSADWVAYCNAYGTRPLARLRARHGHAEPWRMSRWELFTPEGELFAGVVREYERAMRAAEGAEGISVGIADAPLTEVRDRYVAEVLHRLQAADAAERNYYADWYGALSVANDALARLRAGADTVYWPDPPERLLNRPPGAKHLLTERGQLIALFNRFPALVPLVAEGVPATAQSPFQVVAAWTEDRSVLVAFLYNSGTETRRLQLDLAALKSRFAFWAAEQLAGDLTARRTTDTLPVLRKQKAGSALSQVVRIDCLPASFSCVVVKK